MQIRFIGSLFEVCAAIPLEEAGWPKARLRESIRGTLSCNPGKIILLNWSISMIANGTREPFPCPKASRLCHQVSRKECSCLKLMALRE